VSWSCERKSNDRSLTPSRWPRRCNL
jgi:hypothetical protein